MNAPFPMTRPAGRGPSLSPAEVCARGMRREANILYQRAHTAAIQGEAHDEEHEALQASAQELLDQADEMEAGRLTYCPALHRAFYDRGIA